MSCPLLYPFLLGDGDYGGIIVQGSDNVISLKRYVEKKGGEVYEFDRTAYEALFGLKPAEVPSPFLYCRPWFFKHYMMMMCIYFSELCVQVMFTITKNSNNFGMFVVVLNGVAQMVVPAASACQTVIFGGNADVGGAQATIHNISLIVARVLSGLMPLPKLENNKVSPFALSRGKGSAFLSL